MIFAYMHQLMGDAQVGTNILFHSRVCFVLSLSTCYVTAWDATGTKSL